MATKRTKQSGKRTKQEAAETPELVDAESSDETAGQAVRSIPDVLGESADEEQLKQSAVAAETDTESVVPAEIAAIHSDTEVAKRASQSKTVAGSAKVKAPDRRRTKPRQRSAKYLKATAGLKADRSYPLAEAVKLAKETSYTTFDGSVELHVRVASRTGKAETESIRGLVQLPHGTGKAVNAAILTEDLIEQIAKEGSTPYAILIASPQLMPKVATIAKILGPQGKMPSPKAGTVSADPEEVFTALRSGRVAYRADKGGVIHQMIGKVSWDSERLIENAQALLGALGAYQLLSVTISTTMGLGISVDLARD